MSDHQLGDSPIEAAHREQMTQIARVLDLYFNGDAKGKDRAVGFVLMVFPFGEREGRCNYISNGPDRKDIIKLFREQAQRFEDQMNAETETHS